ncbi:MAG: serine/threonine protein phosphatase [Chitinophaga sp.]|uniref:metallophosphoesterase family protein n=1 Tax=Chitinophaga sp. TaxID=1869181 RepID=UPI0025C58D86|nr:metallophosphoesterase family protein [Chitinophaga sp.]MBV8256006.1 serine/threonine protein phosphatase [Chitinophaga sp.]
MKNHRTIVIGDIHGGLRALQQLLERIQPQGADQLIFLGDYVDGWSESAQLIDFLIDLQTRISCIFIKGNHDDMCEAWLSGHAYRLDWMKSHGVSTIKSYEGYSTAAIQEHLHFFRNMHYYYKDTEGRLFIHGGYTAEGGPLAQGDVSVLMRDRTLWELARTMNSRVATHPELYPQKLRLFAEIYIGHTPTLNYDVYKPMHACNVWNMDTGAGFYGRLSGMDIHSKTLFQSDPAPSLYPGEEGRMMNRFK